MFLANLVYNTRYYAKQDTNNIHHSLQKANLFLEYWVYGGSYHEDCYI